MQSLKWCSLAALLAVVQVFGQTASFNKSVIDASPPDSQHLEKAIGFFTSTAYPSYYLGTTSGGYIYDTHKGIKITIDQDGYHYERARSFLYPGDTYPGIVASVNGQTIWYQNPANWNGGDATQQWGRQVLANSWCHDIRLADIDGDGKMDVLCSGTQTFSEENGQIIFQNSYNSWTAVTLFSPAGDGITVLDYNGKPNIVGCSSPNLYWYQNPGGSAARNPGSWSPHYIGDCTEGVSLQTLNVGNREIVVEASNEGGTNNVEVWPSGLAYFDPGSNPTGSWSKVIIDSSYRDVHEIDADTLATIPFITVGEQSQASSACNPDGHNDHPSISGCRVAVFPWTGSSFGTPSLLANLGTQNQTLLQISGTEYMLGANHDAYNDYDVPLYLWTFTFSGVTGGTPLAAGSYNFEDSAGNTWDGGWTQNQPWANNPFVFEYSYNDNSYQQFVWDGSHLKISGDGLYLYNNSNKLGAGQTGTFSILSSGNGYTIQDYATGLYVNSPGQQGPNHYLPLSSVPTVWMAAPVSVTGGTPLAAGTYTVKDSAGNAWDGGWTQNQPWANNPFVFEYSYNDNSYQQFVWDGSHLKISGDGLYLYNNSNKLGAGQTGTFSILSSGNGYTIQDHATGLYVNSAGQQGPNNYLTLSTNPTIWSFGKP